jgi:predicted DNA-binding transcriptional regulator AlpA
VVTNQAIAMPAPARLVRTASYAALLDEGLSSPWQRAKRDPAAPQPVYLGPRTVRWRLEEIEAFIARKTGEKLAARLGGKRGVAKSKRDGQK